MVAFVARMVGRTAIIAGAVVAAISVLTYRVAGVLPACSHVESVDGRNGRGAHGPGVLIKDAGGAPRRSRRADALIVDEAGCTLTEAKLMLAQVVPEKGVDEGRVLAVAAALERGSAIPWCC